MDPISHVPNAYRCPNCDGIGKPTATEAKPGKTVIHFICPYCQRTWNHTKPDLPASQP